MDTVWVPKVRVALYDSSDSMDSLLMIAMAQASLVEGRSGMAEAYPPPAMDMAESHVSLLPATSPEEERLLTIKNDHPDWGLKQFAEVLQREFEISKSKSRKLVKNMNKRISPNDTTLSKHSKRFSSPPDGSVSVPVTNLMKMAEPRAISTW